jgi:hypothetical protein
MAVDVKQLRIGSHVDFNGRRVMIKAIVEDSVAFDYTQDEKQLYLSPNAYDEFLSPIPITPELLTELGFQYRDNTYWERWFLGSFDIERKEGSSYFDYNSEIRLEYLHELEDLYYLIYGVELISE